MWVVIMEAAVLANRTLEHPKQFLSGKRVVFLILKKDNLKIILDTMWISIRVFCLTFSGYQLSTHMQLKQEGNQNIR